MSTYQSIVTINKTEITATGATDVAITESIDIRRMDRFSVYYEGGNAGLKNLVAQVAHDPGPDRSATFVPLSTAILSVPSALGSASTVMSTQVNNAWALLRFVGFVSATLNAGTFTVVVGGPSI